MPPHARPLHWLPPGGPVEPDKLDTNQFALHGFAWMSTYVTALEQLLGWAERLGHDGRLSDLEQMILTSGFGSYLKQLKYGIAMSQDEITRPGDLGLDQSGFLHQRGCPRPDDQR